MNKMSASSVVYRESQIVKNCHFNDKIWVVSVPNVGDKLTGHSMIVVEGLIKIKNENDSMVVDTLQENNHGKPNFFIPPNYKLFIGQYDIKAIVEEIEEETNSFSQLNKKGYISEVRCYESDHYKRDYPKFNHGFHINAEEVGKMIDDIKEDQKKVIASLQNKSDYLKYQFLGHSVLSDKDGGINCPEWCLQKLSVIGIKNDRGKLILYTPEKLANGKIGPSEKNNCLII